MPTVFQAQSKNQTEMDDPYDCFLKEMLEADHKQGAQTTLRALATVQLVEYQIGFSESWF